MKKTATVVFVGDEKYYQLGCGDTCYKYCRDCPRRSNCQKEAKYLFTKGQKYPAYFLEYWQGERKSLHVKGNDGLISNFISIDEFEVLSDPDEVLNKNEAIVRCITHEYDDELFDLNYGKCYKAIGRDKDGLYLVMDESYDCYFYEADCFEIVSDPHGILEHRSMYYSFDGGRRFKPDYVVAHAWSNNHKPELEKDSKCGCFYCLAVFDPKEIKEWLMDDNDCDRRGTALCPYCEIDSVIGENSGYPITPEFLKQMNDYWF